MERDDMVLQNLEHSVFTMIEYVPPKKELMNEDHYENSQYIPQDTKTTLTMIVMLIMI